uniref:Uncharacterized protein n=1 Tax=Anguilla anguilla TaxID=7936 RepID=A0A0E9QEU2_ANGAN
MCTAVATANLVLHTPYPYLEGRKVNYLIVKTKRKTRTVPGLRHG